jgi:hypothetical protein
MDTLYNRTNFHKHTFCIFQEVDFAILESLSLHYRSKSGSSYYFTESGVYRLSNHWSRVANCRWRLQENLEIKKVNTNRIKLGFARWNEFYPDDKLEKLYWISVDFEQKTITFQHKNNPNYSEEKVLRNANETAKVIKQIRLLLFETSWAKYLKYNNIDDLRKELILQLLQTNFSFNEIRRNYLA